MEYQENIIFILVFCFSLVEPIPHSEEARHGAHQGSTWPSNQNQPQQHQNYARPQNFYPVVKNTNTRNIDSRSYERNYNNRYGTLSNTSGEKKPFYEGPNGRNKPYHQPTVSPSTAGTIFKEKLSLEAIPQSYRPTRQYHDYDDRNNERPPHVERNYQYPSNRPYYNQRVPYQRSVSENFGNRFKDTLPQKPRYFDKPVTSQNISPSPLDQKYPIQNRPLSSIPENLRRVPNAAHNSMPELPITSPPRRDINELMSDPVIQNYLASNHKRYLVLHANGSVEHVDSLESIVENYPNFVMIKAGDIITNPQNSTLELTAPIPREENFHSKIPEADQEIFPERNVFPTGHNSREPYVTEKAYFGHIDRPVNIPDHDDAVSQDDVVATLPPTSIVDSSEFIMETTTEHYTTPFLETTTEYNTLSPLIEYNVAANRVMNTEYATPINFVETTTEYLAYSETTSEFGISATPNIDDVSRTLVEQLMKNATEVAITAAEFLTATADYSTLTSVEYLQNITTTENTEALHEDEQIDILSQLFNYPSAFGKFLQRYFGLFFPPEKLNNATKNKIVRRIREVTSASDPFNMKDILEAITQLAMTDQTTTEPVVFNSDQITTFFPFMEDFMYSTSSPTDTTTATNDYQTIYPETPLSLSSNEEEEKPDGLNPFVDTSIKSADPREIKNISVVSDKNNNVSNSYATIDYDTNPFITFDTETNPNLLDYFSTDDISSFTTESESYSTLNPITENIYEEVTNPFIESTTQENKKLPKRSKTKKKLQPDIETNTENITNPFTTRIMESSTIANEHTPDYTPDSSIVKDNNIESNPFTETNPFIQDLQTSHYNGLNPFTENYSDDNITTQSPILTETDERSSNYDYIGNSHENYMVSFNDLPTEMSNYELTSTSEPDYNINPESNDYDEVVPTTITTPGEGVKLTSKEEPAVMFKTDADFWETLTNGSISYDVVYLFPVRDQPLVEKDAKTTIFPNGTIVQEFIETVWEREGDSKPIIVQSTKTVYPEEES